MAPMQTSYLLDQARARILAAIPDAVAIYAFGSVVTGHRGPDSDLDLAVLGRRPLHGGLRTAGRHDPRERTSVFPVSVVTLAKVASIERAGDADRVTVLGSR